MLFTIEDLKTNGASVREVSGTKDGFTVIEIVWPEDEYGQKDIGYNFLKEDGSLLLESYVEDLFQFHKELAFCKFSDNAYNFIKKDGTRLFNEDFSYISGDFCDKDIVGVESPSLGANYIDANGNILFPHGKYTSCKKINKNIFLNIFKEKEIFVVEKDKKTNLIRRDGSLLLKDWYYNIVAVSRECGGLLIVQTKDDAWRSENRRYNFMFADQQELLLKSEDEYPDGVNMINEAKCLIEARRKEKKEEK